MYVIGKRSHRFCLSIVAATTKILILFCIGLSPAWAKEAAPLATKKIHLVTHESPLFMGESYPERGALIFALNKILKKMNYELQIDILSSWPRAKAKAMQDDDIDGYVPYATKENENIFLFSNYFFDDPWVIVERKDNPIQWKKPEDLVRYKAGSVLGVEFRSGIKPLVDAGKLKVTTTSNDINNIRLLATKRVDFIFIDAITYRYLMSSTASLTSYRDQLQVNEKAVTVSQYGLAIKKNHLPPSFLADFNRHASEMNRYFDEYLANLKTPK